MILWEFLSQVHSKQFSDITLVYLQKEQDEIFLKNILVVCHQKTKEMVFCWEVLDKNMFGCQILVSQNPQIIIEN